MEHRWGVRYLLDMSVRVNGKPQELIFARLKDASLSGAYIETRTALPMFNRVWVEFDSDRRDDSNRIGAYVVRTDQRGVAIEWREFAPRAILALIERSRRFLAHDRRENFPAANRRVPPGMVRRLPDAPPTVYMPLKNPPAIARTG